MLLCYAANSFSWNYLISSNYYDVLVSDPNELSQSLNVENFCLTLEWYEAKCKRPAVAGNQTQDTWLVQPVLCH